MWVLLWLCLWREASGIATHPRPRSMTQQAQAPPRPRSKTLEQQAQSSHQSHFNWYAQWYPVHVVETMDETRPHRVELLGMGLVAWHDDTGWRVFEDSCPHRRGPLSEGRVEGGELMCSYHSWKFDGSGRCSAMPSSTKEKHRLSCRARCSAYPTTVRDGLLFVYPTRGAFLEASFVEVPTVAKKGQKVKVPAGVRDFPCGFDAMVENTLDPAHFASAHHNTLGNRYRDPKPYKFAFKDNKREKGFRLEGDFGELEFVPPCLTVYRPHNHQMPFNGSLAIGTYCVPTAPGVVRPLAVVAHDDDTHAKKKRKTTLAEYALALFMSELTPVWLGHVLSSIVLHQDAGLLYYQSRNLRAAQARDEDLLYNDLAFTPTSADLGVVAFRRWLHVYGGKRVPWAPEAQESQREAVDIYDMWNAHTTSCKYCLVAHRNVELAANGAIAAAIAALLVVPDDEPRRIPLALAAFAAASALNFLKGLFHRYEFHHHDNH